MGVVCFTGKIATNRKMGSGVVLKVEKDTSQKVVEIFERKYHTT
jgi:hypothetical protein